MKKFLLMTMFILLGFLTAFAQTATDKSPQSGGVQREKFDPTRSAAADLQVAIVKAGKENKRIVLDVGGEWCGWCIHMDKFIAANAKLKKLRDESFVWVKINMSDENENKEFLSKYPEISGYPHLFVLEKDGSLIKSKDTSELEQGKTYNLQKFVDFLTEYKPAKN